MYISRDTGKQKWFKIMSCFFMLFMFTTSYAKVNAFDKAVDHPPIPLLDEQGKHVLESKKPYSPKKSCEGSGCHDYEAITHAYHFEMGRDEASDTYGAKRGLPHLVSPGYYGGYSCMSGDNPQVLAKKDNPGGLNEFADYGSAGHVKTCMSCHQGGGWAEKDRDGIRYDEKNVADIKFGDGDYYERHTMDGKEHLMLHDWKKSGVGEADCMFCHVDFSTLKLPADSGLEKHDGARKSRQAFSGKGMFREAASGLMELVVNKEGKNLMTVTRAMQPNPGMHGKPGKGESVQPVKGADGTVQFNWHADAFDANGRAVIPMLRFPDNENCMECHRTSNGRRGFYGFGEVATATLQGEDAASILEDDYKDDVHKGKVYVENNGEARTIDNCNACHSKQYYKKASANIDLDANHDFPKGNSDMDVRNDLDYAPNAKSCEECHIKSNNPIVPSGHDTLLAAHRELWKGNGDMAGYSKESLTKITKTHFDVVSCQACHITGKKDKKGKPLPVMYRYRIAEDGLSKIVPYKPYARALWKDKVSGRVLAKLEKASIFKTLKDAEGKIYAADIVDPISEKVLGQISAKKGRHGTSYGSLETYELFMAAKTAYDSLLRKKGLTNPNVALYQSESNEYIISHNTRPSPDSVQCEECHERKQSGAFSSLVSPAGIFGTKEHPVKGRSNIPDPRLVAEGHIILDMKYTKMKPNGDLVQSVDAILYETKIDPFMSLLKNSSASETIGAFQKTSREDMLTFLGPELANLMSPDLPSANNFLFLIEKGRFTLRTMGALVDGNTVNNLLFPTYRGILGLLEGGSVEGAKGILSTRGYGTLRSDVFYFEVRDSSKKHVESFNGASMFVKATYKGNKTDLNAINVVVANWAATSVRALSVSEMVEIKPAKDGFDGYVIFKITEPGYFVIADK
ncbi:MAG: cytochrome C [Methylococcales bacterium]|nr:cytochrome C [Methylococcales bacterium]